ncbi:hypothetical protein BV20DRAFT_964213 [Pilatotrama ljubarskyi]|nr:hypothetical protein BV20DRAFT_964213 [Pilatotrama ljubarskyi]
MAQSFTAMSTDGRRSLAGTTSGFTSEVDEEEIDQLDSGLDDEEDEMEPEVEEDESPSALKGRRKLGVRTPGHTLVPQDKLDNILQAEGAGPHMSKEAVYMLSIATEEFIKKLAEAGYRKTVSENRQHVQYRDLAKVTSQQSAFKFLQDTIPKPISIVEAMARRAAKERQLLEDDPAISAMTPSSPPFMPNMPSVSASISTAAKPKPAVRQSLPADLNGAQKPNGSASAAPGSPSAVASASSASARQRYRDSNGRWRKGATANGTSHREGTPSSTGTRASSARIRNRSARAREAAEAEQPGSHAAYQNGGTSASANGRSAPSASMHQDVHASPGAVAQPESWASGQFTGPASGYLEDGNRLSFNGRNGMTDNPGRTIYSQQRPPQPR